MDNPERKGLGILVVPLVRQADQIQVEAVAGLLLGVLAGQVETQMVTMVFLHPGLLMGAVEEVEVPAG
jgi:hypothetical protein